MSFESLERQQLKDRVDELEQRINEQANEIRALKLWVTAHVDTHRAQRINNALEKTP